MGLSESEYQKIRYGYNVYIHGEERENLKFFKETVKHLRKLRENIKQTIRLERDKEVAGYKRNKQVLEI